jgi:uncharacterized protein (DUF1015 family)
MTKLNNLTNGKVVLSSVIFDVGNQDETKTVITTTNHTVYIHIYKHTIKKAQNAFFYALFYKQDNKQPSILENLDAQILYDKVLLPLLGIEDLRNDERIEYIPGKQSISTIKELVDEGEFEVGFMLFPSDISEIKSLADNNLIMPPKSTYIEPKFRSGLMVYEL